jgi:hypothetical protein
MVYRDFKELRDALGLMPVLHYCTLKLMYHCFRAR